MHSQLLTEHERDMLKKFLESNEKPKGFRLLKHRIIKFHPQLHQDLNLIEKALEKF